MPHRQEQKKAQAAAASKDKRLVQLSLLYKNKGIRAFWANIPDVVVSWNGGSVPAARGESARAESTWHLQTLITRATEQLQR